jgi:hypothetical protein
VLQDVQTFGGAQVKILTAGAYGEPWLDFGKEEGVDCGAKLEKLPNRRYLVCMCTRSADETGHVR